MASFDPSGPRLLIVAEHASTKFGGEAFLPFHFFRVLRSRGHDVRLLSHERVRTELLESFPNDHDRLHFVPDTPLQIGLHRFNRRLPQRIIDLTTGVVMHVVTQLHQRREARRLVRRHGIDLIHEPIPVSPRLPSLLYDVGAPVVIGPLNGGMTYPKAFRDREARLTRSLGFLARASADLLNRLVPGKIRSALILVANQRTRKSLPPSVFRVPVRELVENGVDLARWKDSAPEAPAGRPVRFAFVGRLVGFKGVDLLLEAFAGALREVDAVLEIFGDGPLRGELQARARELGIDRFVTFHGFVAQDRVASELRRMDALALASLFECGGAVVLEAMAVGRPVVAVDWGGPADYLDERSGVLVAPRSKESLVEGFRSAIVRLARDPDLRLRMGRAGRETIERSFDWERKVDRFLDLVRALPRSS